MTDDELYARYMIALDAYTEVVPKPGLEVTTREWLDYSAERSKFALRTVADAATRELVTA